ncbi:hypothetical protein JL722_12484 [Aureococcus anophagefferens]|nr:hypothetical protein JL722_12484 [Aureococcus anophagefferens]
MSCLVGTESPTCVATEATPAPQRADASPKRRKRLSVATTPPRKPCQGNAAPQQVAAKIAYTAAPGAGERAGIVHGSVPLPPHVSEDDAWRNVLAPVDTLVTDARGLGFSLDGAGFQLVDDPAGAPEAAGGGDAYYRLVEAAALRATGASRATAYCHARRSPRPGAKSAAAGYGYVHSDQSDVRSADLRHLDHLPPGVPRRRARGRGGPPVRGAVGVVRRPGRGVPRRTSPSSTTPSPAVEVGRVVLINYGPDEGKLATIIDIVDGNKCLVDGPATKTGVARQVIPFKRVALTDIVVKIPKNARQKTLNKAWDEADVLAKWDASSWAKKLAAKKKRASLTDFQRFQLMVAEAAVRDRRRQAAKDPGTGGGSSRRRSGDDARGSGGGGGGGSSAPLPPPRAPRRRPGAPSGPGAGGGATA